MTGHPLPAGWTGKLWAVKQGIDAAMASPQPPDYLLLTDADIVHDPDSVRRLAAHAQADGLVLTSLMVKLRCESFAERVSIPAFIFFFQMLYPFSWVNRPGNAMAAAAGGCMLVRADALQKAGGIEAIRGALIDDCALAKALKKQGPIWLGLTDRVHSIRPYPDFADIRRMVARSAYAQLGYSPLVLAGTVLGMLLTYLAPPLFALFGSGAARVIGLVTWLMMAIAFQPTLRFYRLSPLVGPRAACYCTAIHALHPRFRLPICARTGRKLEGARASQRVGSGMTTAAELRSGKGHRDENFPVASRLISPKHRAADPGVLRVRAHRRRHRRSRDAAPGEKLEVSRSARSDPSRHQRRRTRRASRCAGNWPSAQLSPRHAQDLLTAFRMDVTKLRYRDWDDLIDYCTFSAMPVGRFVLDVHGESRATWPANDALCAALQIINHLQDCAKDYRDLDRVYIPLDAFAEAGATVEALGAPQASPALLTCIHKLARRTGDTLLRDSRPFSAGIADTRLALEVAVIQTYAERLIAMLRVRDPLSERVHLGKAGVAGLGLVGLIWGASCRIGRAFAATPKPQGT